MFLSIGFALLVQSIGISESVPKFEDFPISIVFKGQPAPPILETSGDRLFRTMIRKDAKKGPNFAGHYTIARWGCGSYCVSMALIDAKTGTIQRSDPFGILGHFSGNYHGDTPDKDAPQLEFQLNSRLLIVRGCPEDENCGTYFYEWTNSKFQLLKWIPAAPREPR